MSSYKAFSYQNWCPINDFYQFFKKNLPFFKQNFCWPLKTSNHLIVGKIAFYKTVLGIYSNIDFYAIC